MEGKRKYDSITMKIFSRSKSIYLLYGPLHTLVHLCDYLFNNLIHISVPSKLTGGRDKSVREYFPEKRNTEM